MFANLFIVSTINMCNPGPLNQSRGCHRLIEVNTKNLNLNCSSLN